MIRRSARRLLQSGVHTPHSVSYNGAKMKHWPEQEIPADFRFTPEQRFTLRAMPRDTGRIPRNYVLGVLYRNQPADVQSLWEHCCADPATVLDSKRHLREVLKQARSEGFIHFERAGGSDEGEWMCLITRERYEEVKGMVSMEPSAALEGGVMKGEAANDTEAYAKEFSTMNRDEKEIHLSKLREQVGLTSGKLREHTRTEVDYLPYTDLNGKVNFMWWYETKSGAPSSPRIPAPTATPALTPE